jgi:CitMHS family citrate-Mg2+:H+ or citrate-Ca2+:H+ symporter
MILDDKTECIPGKRKKERKYKPMSDTILALLGFATVITVIVLLLRNVTVPALAFVSVSTITAAILVATGAFTLDEMAGFIKEGVKGVHGTAILFIFSVLFFGVMTDAGMFDKIIGALMKKVGNNVVGVALMTCLIAIIGHLDGGGASTFLITIPAMLPVYKRLHMRRETLLLICVTSMGVMNLLPWGGPTMRAASVLGVESNDLWSQILPMQIVGLVLAVGTAIFWGLQEKKRIAKLGDAAVEDVGKYDDSDSEEKNNELARPKNFIFNVILTLAVIIVLVLDIFPSYYVFMVGCALGILVNYRGKKLQNSIIKSHASAGLSMASTILCAGVFLGVLSKSGIMEKMAIMMASVIPASLGRFLPVIIGVLSVPLALLFDTDSYFYGLLPVLISVGNQFGVNPAHIAIAMVVCRNCATFISPVAPATYLGIGLAGVEIKDHIKYCFGWQWGVSIVCLVAGLILGVIHF